jgi:hypothetical protein
VIVHPNDTNDLYDYKHSGGHLNLRKWYVPGALALVLAIPGFATTITVGTPNNFGSGLTPTFGALVNFDELTPMSTFTPSTYSSVGIATISNSGAPLLVVPFSPQTPPNYLSTGASDNYAGNITFTFTNPTSMAGFGISEDGTTPVTFTAFGAGGNVLGTFAETVPSTTFNAYYVLSDPSFDIKSISVSAAQNLAVDDVQFSTVPEPSTVALVTTGMAFLLLTVKKRRGDVH